MKIPLFRRFFRREEKEKKSSQQKRGPQLAGRISETEDLLRKTAARLRRRAEAHRLLAPKSADHRAISALTEAAEACEQRAASLREPELFPPS